MFDEWAKGVKVDEKYKSFWQCWTAGRMRKILGKDEKDLRSRKMGEDVQAVEEMKKMSK